jgi:glycosyltransferase involved in cell wall biosynthesis
MKINHDILLSVCIPTYNRSSVLKNTVSNLLRFNQFQFEIVISDNGSSDNTSKVIKRFNDKRISYHSNHENKGFTYNLIRVLELAKGKYVVLLSDEDDLNIENIFKVIDKFKSNNPSLFLGNIIKFDLRSIHDFKTEFHRPGYISLLRFGFRSAYVSGIVFLKESLDFNKYYEQLSLPDYGFLDLYPQQYMVNYLLVNGTTVTTELVFAYQREIGKNFFTPNSHGVKHITPQAVLLLFRKNLSFIMEETRFYNQEKSKLVFLRFRFLIDYTTFYPNMYKNEEITNYFEGYFDNPYDKSKDYKIIIDEALKDIKGTIFKDGFTVKKRLIRKSYRYLYFSKIYKVYYGLSLDKLYTHRILLKVMKQIWK